MLDKVKATEHATKPAGYSSMFVKPNKIDGMISGNICNWNTEIKYAKPNTTGQPFIQGCFSSSGLLGQFSCSDFSYLVKCEFRTWLGLDLE